MKVRIIRTTLNGMPEEVHEGTALGDIAKAAFPNMFTARPYKTQWSNPKVDIHVCEDHLGNELGRVCSPPGTPMVVTGEASSQTAEKPAPKPRAPRQPRKVVASTMDDVEAAKEALKAADDAIAAVKKAPRKRAAKKAAEPVAVEA